MGRNSTNRKGKLENGEIICILLGVISVIFFIGLLIALGLSPSHERTLIKLTGWSDRKSSDKEDFDSYSSDTLPDWTLENWTPIEVNDIDRDENTGLIDADVKLCQLNFKAYSSAPHIYPMFKDVVMKSNCRRASGNLKEEKLSVLLAKHKENLKASIDGTDGKMIKKYSSVLPSGFVFHESRVGSTLVANILASNPWNLVFSECDPTHSALMKCQSCNHEEAVQLFRDVVTLMGISPVHKRMFFKFQSATTTNIKIALEAFPSTPWAFIFRQPVQTMMSHLDPRKGQIDMAPCLRSRNDRNPQPEISEALEPFSNLGRPSKEAWCAAHLNMLCRKAIAAYESFGLTTSGQRGVLVDYDSLPGSMVRVVFSLFGLSKETSQLRLNKINEEAKSYSKSRGMGRRDKPAVFTGDSEDKENHATDAIKEWASKVMEPTYHILSKLADESMTKIAPKEMENVPYISSEGDDRVEGSPEGEDTETEINKNKRRDWKALNAIPERRDKPKKEKSKHLNNMLQRSDSETYGNAPDRHSQFDIEELHKTSPFRDVYEHEEGEDYLPWAPFASKHSSMAFERIKCPKVPPSGYPNTYPVMDLINNWNPDVTDIPAMHYDSLCHFDLSLDEDYAKALEYRKKEVPFVGYNMPEVDDVVERWSSIGYLKKKIGTQKYRTEASKDNHFMYWTGGNKKMNFFSGKKKNWSPPTSIEQVDFTSWLKLAVKGQNQTLGERTHKYFRVTAEDNHRSQNKWLFEELKFFQPKPTLFMVRPEDQQGIHCRFGMRSVIAEAHFDRSRNSIAMLRGLRRWIMTPPKECEHMYMLPKEHPSGRHSEVDWSKPDLDSFPDFENVKAHEVILQPGDFLYIPTNWIHYIVSLNVNIQCNSRSGVTKDYDKDIRKCGF